jgi:hypothetical protein
MGKGISLKGLRGGKVHFILSLFTTKGAGEPALLSKQFPRNM